MTQYVDNITEFADEFASWCEENGGTFHGDIRNARMSCTHENDPSSEMDPSKEISVRQDEYHGITIYDSYGGGGVNDVEKVKFDGNSFMYEDNMGRNPSLIVFGNDEFQTFLHENRHPPEMEDRIEHGDFKTRDFGF